MGKKAKRPYLKYINMPYYDLIFCYVNCKNISTINLKELDKINSTYYNKNENFRYYFNNCKNVKKITQNEILLANL